MHGGSVTSSQTLKIRSIIVKRKDKVNAKLTQAVVLGIRGRLELPVDRAFPVFRASRRDRAILAGSTLKHGYEILGRRADTAVLRKLL
jgi:hypothetical protein